MSIEIGITADEFQKLGRMLAKEKEVICLDHTSHVKTLLVARERLARGHKVTAKIVKGYDTTPGTIDGPKLAPDLKQKDKEYEKFMKEDCGICRVPRNRCCC